MRIVNYQIKNPLTDEENKSYEKKFATYLKKNLVPIMMMTIKSTIKSEIIAITMENLEELLIVHVT